MADFDVVQYGFSKLDETINFGTRYLADGNNLHETSTLATFVNIDENIGVEDVVIDSLKRLGHLYISTNKSLKILRHKDCTDAFMVAFDSIVDSFTTSEDNKYLFLCFRCGTVRIFDISNGDLQLVFESSYGKNMYSAQFYINSFFVSSEKSVFIVNKMGKIIRLCINEKNSDEENDEKIEVIAEEVYECNFEITSAALIYPVFFLSCSHKAFTIDVGEKCIISEYNDCSLIKIIPIELWSAIGLQSNGQLIRINTVSMSWFDIELDTFYQDIVYNKDFENLLAVTKKNELGNSFIYCLTYPDFEIMYSISVSENVHLITPESVNEEVMYLSEIQKNNKVTELRLCQIYETEPEKRLGRLIRRQEFTEAEAFAKLFNIDSSIINKAKAEVIVDKCECNSEDIKLLIDTLETLNDIVFKMQCCITVQYCCVNYEDVKTILNYGCALSINLKKFSEDDTVELRELQKALTTSLFRFDTFLAIYTAKNYNMDTWTNFSQCNLLDELKTQLQEYRIEESIILYGRLDEQASNSLNIEEIEEIIEILNVLPVNVYQPFLPSFIPISLTNVPSSLSIFVKWLHNKIFQMEKRDSAHFPENGLKFADQIMKLLKVDSDSSKMQFKRHLILNKNEFNKLNSLLQSLKQMRNLKNNFRVNIPLTNYLQGPQAVIRCLLNINLNLTDYDILLNNFLCPLILENDLNQDEILFEEIKYMMQFTENTWVNTISALLKYINSVETKLQAVIMILNTALVPWCHNIRNIAKDALKYSHSLVSVIRDIIKFEPLMVVLTKPKYKLKNRKSLNNNEFIFSINRIVHCNDKNMVKDVFTLCDTPLRKYKANIVLIKHFIQNGDTKKAFEILDNNTPKDIKKCAKYFASYAAQVICEPPVYYDILGSLHKRWKEHTVNSFDKDAIDDHLIKLRNCYAINKTFNIQVRMSQLSNNAEKKCLLNELILQSVTNFEIGCLDIAEVYEICRKISVYLQLNKEDVIIKFCETVENFNIILMSAKYLFENSNDTKTLCLITVLLMKYLGHIKVKQIENTMHNNFDNSFVVPTFTESSSVGSDTENILAGLELIEKITSKAVLYCDVSDLDACLEVIYWVDTTFYLTRNSTTKSRKILAKETYYGVSPMNTSTCSLLRNIFYTYFNFVGQFNLPENKYLTYFNADVSTVSEEQLIEEIELLLTYISSLCREGQLITAYKIIVNLNGSFAMYSSIINPEILKKLEFFNKAAEKICLHPLLQSVVSANYIDCNLLFKLLICCGAKFSMSFLGQSSIIYKRNPRKFAAIAHTKLHIFDYYKQTEGRDTWNKIVLCCKWWMKLESRSKMITYKPFFVLTQDNLLEQLIENDCLDLNDMKNFCIDFKLDVQVYYIVYLKRILLNWNVDYEVVTDTTGERNLVINTTEADLTDKCASVIKLIDNKEIVFNTMKAIWNMVNFYNYEVFLGILHIFECVKPNFKFSENDWSILRFYKVYKRINKPNVTENELWLTTFPKTQKLDPLSEFRLPFVTKIFPNNLKIICPEITLSTYESWFTSINYLNKDDICTYVVNNVVSSGILKSDKNEEWCLQAKHEDLFEEIDKCVQNIQDIEKATSALYHLLNNTPKGADQVNAARICYKYALKYKTKKPSPEVEKAFIKVQAKFFIHSIIHVLHLYKLADKKYIDLVANPEQLIIALYHDKRIISNVQTIQISCPDVNKAANAIADLYESIDLKNIQHDLLNGWILDSAASTSLDNTNAGALNVERSDCGQFGDDNLKRAYYLCSGNNMIYWISYLMKIVENTDEETNRSSKARALKVICTIADGDTIAPHISTSYDEFVTYMEKLTLLSDLEMVGFSLEIENLLVFNKELMNRLALHGVYPTNLRIMANLCISHTIYDLRYWEFIIKHCKRLKMIEDLKHYVNFLKNQPCLYKDFYITAWQLIIDEAFSNPHIQINSPEDLTTAYVDNFMLIQSCPVLFNINFEQIFLKCVRVSKIDFAAFLLQYLPVEKRSEFGKIVLKNENILKDIDRLSQKGLWGVNNVKSILNTL